MTERRPLILALAFITIFLAAAPALHAVATQDLYVAFHDDFTSVTEWTFFDGNGSLTLLDNTYAHLISPDYVVYMRSLDEPASTMTYDLLTAEVTYLEGMFWVWVVGEETTLVMNVSVPGTHTADLKTATGGDVIDIVLIEVLLGEARVDTVTVGRTVGPHAIEFFEYGFNAYSAANPWAVPTFLIIGMVVAFGFLLIPPIEKRPKRRYHRL